LNVNHHPLAVDVADLQVCQLSVPHSGGVERHQQNAMVGSERSVDESRDFFLVQNRRKVKCSFGIGSLGDAPGLFESLDVEETQSRQVVSPPRVTTSAFEIARLGIPEYVAVPSGQAGD